MSLKFVVLVAVFALAGCTRSFFTPTRDGAFLITGSSASLQSGAEEKAGLVEDANDYCERHGKSAVVIASSQNDATPGNLAAPGKLARATVKFRCE
ncbi:MAG: hypothetical protein C4338_01350 [Rhodanobacteraceae bacterium]